MAREYDSKTATRFRFEVRLICEDNACGGELWVKAPWANSEVEDFYECPDCSGEMERSQRPGSLRRLTNSLTGEVV